MGALLDHDGFRRLLRDPGRAGHPGRMEQLPRHGERPRDPRGRGQVSRGREEIVVMPDPNEKDLLDPHRSPGQHTTAPGPDLPETEKTVVPGTSEEGVPADRVNP